MALLPRYVSSATWRPAGIKSLEANALSVVLSTDNRSVIAGPGSGKTELLAQRASYLLQCNVSPRPRRILAISYKRDAALTLAERVAERCNPDQAYRLDSLTFDAFAKSLVDRFGQALPKEWRPTANYNIATLSVPMIESHLRSLSPPASVGTPADMVAIHRKTFERQHVVGSPLSDASTTSGSPAQWAARELWKAWLHGSGQSSLTFAMIGRLAELLVRTNPMVAQALRLTYSHLFMDEFQDTTRIQYDLVKTIFLGSDTVVTAVGDNKQQIMRFAMAMDNPFAPYEADFRGQRTPLKNNYRSSQDLVRIQDILARELDSGSITPVSKSVKTVSGDCCQIWDFGSSASEAAAIADFVASEIAVYALQSHDFCLLVRGKPQNYLPGLESAFARRGLKLRNEAASIGGVPLQELASETLSKVLVTLLRLAASSGSGRHWSDGMKTLCYMRGIAVDDEDARTKVSAQLDAFATDLLTSYPTPVQDRKQTESLVESVVEFVGVDCFLTASPAYRQGDWLLKVLGAAIQHLQSSSEVATTWSEALDTYEGLQATPLMTIHKSKGLEYHTVMFIGLDDNAWWGYKEQRTEETCSFFVAFTRAKQRVIFTYCSSRGMRQQIAPLYALLKSAGVKTLSK
jgi:superfamily I DNA/RNA helicase